MPDPKPIAFSSAPAPQPSVPAQSAPAQAGQLKSKADEFIKITATENAQPGYEFRAECLKCGWQTYQLTRKLVYDATVDHLRGKHSIQ